jgi:hypothetical protein
MKAVTLVTMCCAALSCFGCGKPDDAPTSQPTTAPAVRSVADVLAEAGLTEFGTPDGMADTIAVAKAVGVDYRKTVADCLANDSKALSVLLRLTRDVGFDAASAQGHAAVLGQMLRHAGDRYFGRCLASQPAAVKSAVRDYLLYDLGYGEGPITMRQIRARFPHTFPADYDPGY